MTIAIWLLTGHFLALLFGLAGMLIAMPNPQLWAGSPLGVQVFAFGMQHSGATQIVLGALTMAAVGAVWLGWRRMLVFFALSTLLSLGMELLGTGSGWPFGAYEYTAGLGAKVAGRVPYSIPLSWFTMGLASYLIGGRLASQLRHSEPWLAIPIGVWLLTVWDLVLDPSMAHESLPMQFWVWHQTGPYFGMPIQNFVGWSATGALFMGLSHLVWRTVPCPSLRVTRMACAVYFANVAFAVVLSVAVGLWVPVVLAITLGVAPAAMAAIWKPSRDGSPRGRLWSASRV
jgi:putative membrane protein